MKRKTNFDKYLEEQMRDPDFAERFQKAGEAWDIAIQLSALRKKSGMSQQDLAKKVGTSQQQISRMESPSYEGHSLSMLRKVAKVLGASVQVKILHNFFQYHIISDNKITYRNSWVTDITVDKSNVVDLVTGGRARWKIENEVSI